MGRRRKKLGWKGEEGGEGRGRKREGMREEDRRERGRTREAQNCLSLPLPLPPQSAFNKSVRSRSLKRDIVKWRVGRGEQPV